LPSRIAATIPQGGKEQGGWNVKELLERGDERKMGLFSQYAMVAAGEALGDAGWCPNGEEDLEATVC
jgi:3-oxoacyl-[acyl-carrier-protein] synthase II